MANINIEIPDDIYKKAKLAAIMQEKTVKDFVIEKLAAAMRRKKR